LKGSDKPLSASTVQTRVHTRSNGEEAYMNDEIIYKYDNGRGAVLCRKCRVILNKLPISYNEAVKRWAGKDLCDECGE
jgi:hypothetical protein